MTAATLVTVALSLSLAQYGGSPAPGPEAHGDAPAAAQAVEGHAAPAAPAEEGHAAAAHFALGGLEHAASAAK